MGELKILGYSAYLHPAGKDLLIGIGQDATEEGFRSGAQVSLFDVSDPAAPDAPPAARASAAARLDRRVRPPRVPVVAGHQPRRAPGQHLYAVVQRRGGRQRSSYCCGDSFTGAIGFGITREAITEAGRVSHDAGGYPAVVTRSLVVRGRLYTLSDAGLKVSRLDTLADLGWVPFPAG